MGDERTYDYAIALRAVNTIDFMTVESAQITYEDLNKYYEEQEAFAKITKSISKKLG